MLFRSVNRAVKLSYATHRPVARNFEDLIALASIIVAKGMGEVAARDVQSAGQTLRRVHLPPKRLQASPASEARTTSSCGGVSGITPHPLGRRRWRRHRRVSRCVLHCAPMRVAAFFFAYFWFSPHSAAGEA